MPVFDLVDQQPLLFSWGADLALVWSHGSAIYNMGVIPDNRLDMLILDRATLAPKSALLEIANSGQGGLLDTQFAAVGANDLLALFHITFHMFSVPGSASVRCAPL
jgi:hypothetical protein